MHPERIFIPSTAGITGHNKVLILLNSPNMPITLPYLKKLVLFFHFIFKCIRLPRFLCLKTNDRLRHVFAFFSRISRLLNKGRNYNIATGNRSTEGHFSVHNTSSAPAHVEISVDLPTVSAESSVHQEQEDLQTIQADTFPEVLEENRDQTSLEIPQGHMTIGTEAGDSFPKPTATIPSMGPRCCEELKMCSSSRLNSIYDYSYIQ